MMAVPKPTDLVALQSDLAGLIDLVRERRVSPDTIIAAEYAERLAGYLARDPAPGMASFLTIELFGSLIELVALLILLKSARLLEIIFPTGPTEAERESVLLRIRQKAEELREELRLSTLPLPPGAGMGMGSDETGDVSRDTGHEAYVYVSLTEIAEAFENILALETSVPMNLVLETVTLEAILRKLRVFFLGGATATLQEIWGDQPIERCVTLLASLEMARTKELRLEQDRQFGDVRLVRVSISRV